MAAHIFLTQTYLDVQKIGQAIAFKFQASGKVQNISLKDMQNTDLLARNWTHMQSLKQLLIQNFDSKDEFRDSIFRLYEIYPEPTLLFLGDLNSYSTQLQEGMLRLLEEPPHNLEIILFAQNRSEILLTILSRVKVINIPNQVIMSTLDSDLLEKVKTKLPQPIEFCKQLLQTKSNQKIELPDLSKVEREELDFWLWQLQIYFGKFFEQRTQFSYADFIARILKARQLNSQNLQKKLALSQINIPIEIPD